MEQNTVTWEEIQKRKKEKLDKLKALPFEEQLKITVEKMVKIVRGNTGGSQTYAEMLLSMLPNSSYKVCINDWNYRADRDDFEVMLELIRRYGENNQNSPIWVYEELVRPYYQEIEDFLK